MLKYFLFFLFLTTALKAEEPPQVIVLTSVKEGSLSHQLNGVGTFTAYSDIVLKAPTSGRINAIHFKEGEHCKANQELITFYNKEQEASLRKAEAALKLSQTSFHRKKELYKKQFISPQDLENSEAKVKSDEAEVALAKEQLEKTHVFSPFDGVLSSRKVSKGSYVLEGDELVRIQDLTPIRLTFQLPQRDIPLIKVGDKVLATTDIYPDKTFEGKIEAIEPSVNEETRSVTVFATFDNKEELLIPGLYGNALLTSSCEKKKTLVIAEQTLLVRQDGTYVYKKENDIAVLTKVTLGIRTADQAEITSGLKLGDQIVLEGQDKIHDGSPITTESVP
ncbi:MAG: efflux RND transporter periplasmic adaptor subunit [Alphaproteobacteria bacterium]|nr:efflux RND transporter periplasmic adaptor subunit [Alphaproteobacteria bacterium]